MMTTTTVIAIALVAVALLHGSAAGIRAASGRDGRLYHRRAEGLGAVRGMLTVAALLAPAAIGAGIDALRDADRLELYVDAAYGMLLIYGPVATVTTVAFIVVRAAPWQVRAFLNSVVIAGLEFLRPAIAWVGVGFAWWFTRDAAISVLAAIAITAGLQASRVVTRVWYSAPAVLPNPIPQEAHV
jgi:hypothetical protein